MSITAGITPSVPPAPRFEWNVNDFNPNFGGINRHVRLHVTGAIYQTLPLYDGLKTTGVYVYPTNISVRDRTADVTVESQVHNSSSEESKRIPFGCGRG